MIVGAVLFGIGLLIWIASRLGLGGLPLGRLPGDIAIERENFRFYFPLATSILISVILSLIVWIIRWFKS